MTLTEPTGPSPERIAEIRKRVARLKQGHPAFWRDAIEIDLLAAYDAARRQLQELLDDLERWRKNENLQMERAIRAERQLQEATQRAERAEQELTEARSMSRSRAKRVLASMGRPAPPNLTQHK